MAKGGLVSEGGRVKRSDRGNDPRTYRIAFPAQVVPRPCPFEGGSVRLSTLTEMMVHLWNRHVRDTVVIL